MAVRATATIAGLDELRAAMGRFGAEADKELLENTLRIAARPMQRSAKSLAPRSGRHGLRKPLADTIRISTSLTRRQRGIRQLKAGEAYIWVGSTAKHAHLVERGHMVKARGPARKGQAPRSGVSFVSPRPFMRPAFEMNVAGFPAEFAKAVRPAIKRITNAWKRDAKRGKPRRRTLRQFGGR